MACLIKWRWLTLWLETNRILLKSCYPPKGCINVTVFEWMPLRASTGWPNSICHEEYVNWRIICRSWLTYLEWFEPGNRQCCVSYIVGQSYSGMSGCWRKRTINTLEGRNYVWHTDCWWFWTLCLFIHDCWGGRNGSRIVILSFQMPDMVLFAEWVKSPHL